MHVLAGVQVFIEPICNGCHDLERRLAQVHWWRIQRGSIISKQWKTKIQQTQSHINHMHPIKIHKTPGSISEYNWRKTSRLQLHIISVQNYLFARRWPAAARPATPACRVEGEEIGPPAPAEQSWVLQCWIWAQSPGCFPWSACLLSWPGTCARPGRVPRQRTYQGTGPGEWEGTKEGRNDICF